MADASSHARHDRFAVAAALGGAAPPQALGSCLQCGALHQDLLTIQTALRHAWTPRRQRDLRLSRADIARLRPALWHRVLGAIGSTRDAITRPLAVGLTSLGIVGVVLSGTAFAFGGAAGTAAPTDYAVEIMGRSEPPPVERTVDGDDRPADPLLAASVGSLAAGSGLFLIRRVARRVRGVR